MNIWFTYTQFHTFSAKIIIIIESRNVTKENWYTLSISNVIMIAWIQSKNKSTKFGFCVCFCLLKGMIDNNFFFLFIASYFVCTSAWLTSNVFFLHWNFSYKWTERDLILDTKTFDSFSSFFFFFSIFSQCSIEQKICWSNILPNKGELE